MWTALLEKIKTKQKLARLGIISPESDVCVLCSYASESCNHLILQCDFSQQLWHWWMDLWEVKWVFPHNLRCTFEQWKSPKKIPFFEKVLHACFFVIAWSIWKECNIRIFEHTSNSPKQIEDLQLLRIRWWIKGWSDDFPYSPMDIQRNPTCLIWRGFSSVSSFPMAIPSPCEWTPPEVNNLKWNVDASVNLHSSSSAIGGILRNHVGNFVCMFSSPIPFMEIDCAEILAIHHAIKISLSSDVTKHCMITLESDSLNAVQ